ncbi:MAG: phospholipase D-like domain-containing protein [Candidatus Eremiobacteraeota bacterium]|nr:phospholipase D-like domain-containing protein [Candidatus Eremiobacteraeota bacterium]
MLKNMLITLCLGMLLTAHGAAVWGQEAPALEIVESVPMETSLDIPEVRNTRAVWLSMLGGAKKTLDIEQFYFANKPGESLEAVINAIADAAERGVKVRIIAEEKFRKESQATADFLEKKPNVTWRWIKAFDHLNGIQHGKFFIVDGKETFLGSQNFDWRALSHISEVGVRICHEGFARCATDLFEMDWTHTAAPAPTPRDRHYQVPFLMKDQGGQPLEFYPVFDPKGYIPDSALWEGRELLRLIKEAKKEIMVQVLTFSPVARGGEYWHELDSALREAATRKVEVRLIFSDWSTEYPEIDHIKSLALIPRVSIKLSTIPKWSGGFIPFARTQHGKYMIVDDEYSWVGSSNWEKDYFYNCRNLGIVMKGGSANRTLRKIFLTNWTGPYVRFVDVNRTYVPPIRTE